MSLPSSMAVLYHVIVSCKRPIDVLIRVLDGSRKIHVGICVILLLVLPTEGMSTVFKNQSKPINFRNQLCPIN